jgi:zinc transport system substrate-binding protein
LAGNRQFHFSVIAGLAGLAAGVAGCDRGAQAPPAPVVAATNSYLASAVQDITHGSVAVVSFAPPGTCPGHFDLRPSQVDQLRSCRLLLRFDFQQAIDAHLLDGRTGPAVASIEVPGALCEPADYLEACRQVSRNLVACGLAPAADAERQVAKVERRMDDLSSRMRQQVRQAGVTGRPVLCSGHQEGFCHWLGLNVVATFRGGDSDSLGQLDEAIRAGRQAGAKLVVANHPEGRGAADALAEKLGAQVVVFDNFPAEPTQAGTFETMVQQNVKRLIQAGGHE